MSYEIFFCEKEYVFPPPYQNLGIFFPINSQYCLNITLTLGPCHHLETVSLILEASLYCDVMWYASDNILHLVWLDADWSFSYESAN